MAFARFGLLSSHPPPAATDAAWWLCCPALDGADPTLSELLVLTPRRDANQALLDTVQQHRGRWPPGSHAALFGSDPFRRPQDLIRPLLRVGVPAVINYPSVGLFDGGFGASLAAAGHEFEQELLWLQEARAAGLATMAVVGTLDHGLKACAAGVEALMVHPGWARADVAANMPRAAEVREVLLQLRASCAPRGPTLLLYRPVGFGAALDDAARAADSVIWRAGPGGGPLRG